MPDASSTSRPLAQPDQSPSSRRPDLEVSEVTGSGVSDRLKFGAVVRTNIGATGRYIGHDLALYVCAQDNDLGLAGINLGAEPWSNSPLPTDDACRAASVAYAAGLNDAQFGVGRG